MTTRKTRRIITGHDASGRSTVVYDGPTVDLGTLHEIWSTFGSPCAIDADGDPAGRPVRIVPGPAGSVFRLVRIEPEHVFAGMSEEERRERTRRAFAAISSDHALEDTTLHPAMHRTQTVDYIVVLCGRLILKLENREIEIEPFDVVVQRGTNHAWVNPYEEPALLAAVLIDAAARDDQK